MCVSVLGFAYRRGVSRPLDVPTFFIPFFILRGLELGCVSANSIRELEEHTFGKLSHEDTAAKLLVAYM